MLPNKWRFSVTVANSVLDDAVRGQAEEFDAVEPDRAGGRHDQARYTVEQRRLAGAVRAEDRHRLADRLAVYSGALECARYFLA